MCVVVSPDFEAPNGVFASALLPPAAFEINIQAAIMVSMKRLTVAMTVAVIILTIAVIYLVRKSNQMERAMKPSIHLIVAAVR
jgi:hypothetical protein